VLYALRYPFSFGVLLGTFVVGVTVRGLVQQLISGERRPKWVRANTRRRRPTWFKPYFDAYGVIAFLLGGVGWGAPVDTSDPRHQSRGRRIGQLLVAPLVLAGMGVGLLLAFRSWSHLTQPRSALFPVVSGQAFAGSTRGHLTTHFQYGLPFGQVALFLAGVELLAMGVLAILPMPPLDGGRLLFLLTPRSGGWKRARFRLDEENWGLLILLFCAIPVLFRRVILISVLGVIVNPLVRLIA
jgi:hypothetical protein